MEMPSVEPLVWDNLRPLVEGGMRRRAATQLRLDEQDVREQDAGRVEEGAGWDEEGLHLVEG